MSLGMMLSLGMRLRLKNKAEPGNEAVRLSLGMRLLLSCKKKKKNS